MPEHTETMTDETQSMRVGDATPKGKVTVSISVRSPSLAMSTKAPGIAITTKSPSVGFEVN